MRLVVDQPLNIDDALDLPTVGFNSAAIDLSILDQEVEAIRLERTRNNLVDAFALEGRIEVLGVCLIDVSLLQVSGL